MPAKLGIVQGDIWAFREGSSFPLVPAQIMNQPAHYQASITIRLINSPERGLLSVRRVKLPVRWERVKGYIVTHADVPTEILAPDDRPLPTSETAPLSAAAVDMFSIGEATLRRIVREELEQVLGKPVLALSYTEAARSVGYSESTLRMAVDRGDLVASFANSKPVFSVTELERWLRTLPSQPPR